MSLELQLRAALSPCEPGPEPLAFVLARLSTPEKQASRDKHRKREPLILLGTILVVAAAAAMVGWQLRDAEPQPVLTAALPPPAPEAIAEVVESAPPTALPATQSPPAAATPRQTAPAVKPFTVRVDLYYQSTNEAAGSALRLVHSAFIERLRVIPGLTLVEPDSTGVAADADYRIVIKGGDLDSQGNFNVAFDTLKKVASLGGVPSISTSEVGTTANILSRCDGPPADDISAALIVHFTCQDPAGVAAFQVGHLRLNTFPQDASLLQQLQYQLANPTVEPGNRLFMLGNVSRLRPRFPGAAFDSMIVASALDLAASPDPAVRAETWRTMRDFGSKELVEPLIAASSREADGQARLEAVATLAADFASDERVRSVLQVVSLQDSRAGVRAAARRGLTGETEWKQYIVDSLKDGSRPDAERVEALAHHAYRCNSRLIANLLDEAGKKALAELLPRLQASPAIRPCVLNQLEGLVRTGPAYDVALPPPTLLPGAGK